MNKKNCFLIAAVMCCCLFAGCKSAWNVSRADDLHKEDTIIFTRPTEYTMWFGTRSQRDFIDIAYERFTRNAAGQPVVEVGIRYRGPHSWTDWMMRAPENMVLATRCNFYSGMNAQKSGGPILYSTNRAKVVIKLGETYAYRAVCPVKQAQSYQLVLGE